MTQSKRELLQWEERLAFKALGRDFCSWGDTTPPQRQQTKDMLAG